MSEFPEGLSKKNQKMFEFMNRLSGENKKEYKRRIKERGTEIMKGTDCTEEERISITALQNCKSPLVIIGEFRSFLGLTKEEYALRKGNALAYEKFIKAVYFKNFDLIRFEYEKARIREEEAKERAQVWDDLREIYIERERERAESTYFFEDALEERLEKEEALEEQGHRLAYKTRFGAIGK